MDQGPEEDDDVETPSDEVSVGFVCVNIGECAVIAVRNESHLTKFIFKVYALTKVSKFIYIVGLQHYHGVAHPGEYVNLVREANNKYDRNAIRVLNLRYAQVGHINRHSASALAPLIDTQKARFEASISSSGHYSQPCEIHVFCPSQYAEEIRSHLRCIANQKQGLAAVKINFSLNVAPSVSSGLVKTTSISGTNNSQADLERIFEEIERSSTAKLSSFDSSVIAGLLDSSCHLYGHQLQAIAWMLNREKTTSLLPFWSEIIEKGVKVFFNSITNSSQVERPLSVSGGILADDMVSYS